MKDATYNPLIFEAPTLEAAKGIIVTEQAGLSTDERWATETPYLAELIGNALKLRPGQLVLDYGCGIGRISKALIERFDVLVLGVDMSQQMRGFAPSYVDSSAFSVVSRRLLQALAQRGLQVDAAISVWVLQHCLNPAEDIGLIRMAIRPGGPFMVVNNDRRSVPSVEHGWLSDDLDVGALLKSTFRQSAVGRLDEAVVSKYVADRTFWGLYQD
jgi:SAM-dependent methyltransferase